MVDIQSLGPDELEALSRKFIQPVTCLENLVVTGFDGSVLTGRARITETALNAYGHAHGGWLYTLCDMMSGVLVRLQGRASVTLSSSINYLKGGNPGDTVNIAVSCTHSGRTTVVNEVRLTNQNDALLATATFTMFVTSQKPLV